MKLKDEDRARENGGVGDGDGNRFDDGFRRIH